MTPSARPDSDSGRSIPKPALGAGLVALSGGVVYLTYLNRFFQLDDALIYQRYVRNLLDGQGLVFNPGERINALTSPLFTYLSILASWALSDVALAATVVAGVTWLLALCCWWYAFAWAATASVQWGGTPASRVAVGAGGALFALLFPFTYRTFGMETTLFLALVGLCLGLFAAQRALSLSVATTLLVLTRPEGIFLIVAMAIEHRRLGRAWPRLRLLVLPATLLAAHLLFLWSYYGSPLSESGAAKVIQGRSGLWGSWPPMARVGYHLDWFFGGSLVQLGGLLVLASVGFVALRRSSLVTVAGTFLLLLTTFYFALSLPNYHWYYAPYYLFGLFLAGAGATWLWSRVAMLAASQARWIGRIVLACLVGLWLAQSGSQTIATIARSATPHPYRGIGEWLASHSGGGAKVAAMEIGILGWYSHRYLFDIAGLVTPENARHLAAGRFDAWLSREPDYIVVHQPPWRLERAATAAVRAGRYRPIPTIGAPGYELLERLPDSRLGSTMEAMNALKVQPNSADRSQVLSAAFEGRLGPLVELAGSKVVAVNLSPDGWTRGTTPTAVITRPMASSRELTLRLTCLAGEPDLPIRVLVDDGSSRREIEFEVAGTREVEIAGAPERGDRLVAIWADEAWQPAGRDRRWLGVHVAVSLVEDLE